MNTLAIYCRASTEDGSVGESATIQNQRDLLYHFIQTTPEFMNWNVMEFQDDGWTGTNFDRPSVQKMLKLAGKQIQCIIVKDFSRFGRNLIEVGNYLDQVFPFLGVRFIAVNENYDSTQHQGCTIGLDVSLKAMVYEMYSRDLSKKISSVKQAQMKRGQYTGGFVLFGYKKSQTMKNQLEINEETANIVRRIFSMAASGMKLVQIATTLNAENIPSPCCYQKSLLPATTKHVWMGISVRNIIKDERYTGCYIGGKTKRADITMKRKIHLPPEEWIRVENTQEAIVSKEFFEKAQRIFKLTSQKRIVKKPLEPKLFQGILKCSTCGRTLQKFHNDKFTCPTKAYAPHISCASIQLIEADLAQTVLSQMKQHVQENVFEKDTVSPKEHILKQLEQIQGNLKRYKTNQVYLFEQLADGKLNPQQFTLEKQTILEHITELKAKQDALNVQLQDTAEPKHCSSDFGKQLTREMLVQFVQEIEVFPDNTIQIQWK